MKINIGIIGCGGISPSHINIYSGFPEEVQIVAVCDVVKERAQNRKQVVHDTYLNRAKEYQKRAEEAKSQQEKDRYAELAKVCQNAAEVEVKVYTSHDELVQDKRIDAVNICTPPFAHPAPMIAAANSGKHVFCEGPIAGDLKEADAMIAAARDNQIKFTVQYGTRISRGSMMAKKAIDDGKLGQILMGKVDVMWYRMQSYYDSGAWRGTWAGERGGATFHHGRYAIDLYLWLMGEVSEVYAQMDTFTHDIELEDCSMSVLRFRHGALGQIMASTSAHPGIAPSQRIEIFGEKAAISVIPSWNIGSSDGDYAKQLQAGLEAEIQEPTHSGMVGQMKDFIDAILADREPYITGESVRAQVEITKGIYKSVATGLPVKLPMQPYDPFYGG
jgi:predicted dehydrogenase